VGGGWKREGKSMQMMVLSEMMMMIMLGTWHDVNYWDWLLNVNLLSYWEWKESHFLDKNWHGNFSLNSNLLNGITLTLTRVIVNVIHVII
jgi:hypothetical protein